MSIKKILLYGVLFLVAAGGLFFYYSYSSIYNPNINIEGEESIIYVEEGTTYQAFKNKLIEKGLIENESSFDFVSKLMTFSNSQIKPGRYKILPNTSNRTFISKIRSGNQEAVNVTFNNVRTLDQLAGKITKNLEIDSINFLTFLRKDPFIQELNYDQESLMSLFIPNTYKMYWNISSKEIVQRLHKEHNNFWNSERLKKAKSLNLSTKEVYTLASIVDRESLRKDEKPRIAGLYHNRLEQNIALQADPTVVFALKKFDLKRVLNKHLEVDNPYNTYKYPGLPPGPIGMASISGLDATLNKEDHEFIFMCAKPEGNGKHAFAKTLSGHNKNARIYQSWLNKKGIR